MAVQISRAPLDVSQVGSPSRGPIFKGATRTPLVQREICCACGPWTRCRIGPNEGPIASFASRGVQRAEV